jgi:hypothetical protein
MDILGLIPVVIFSERRGVFKLFRQGLMSRMSLLMRRIKSNNMERMVKE